MASYGPTFFGIADRRYCISLRTGPRSQTLIVFLDRLVRRAISLIDRPSRNRIRRTFAYIAMVCTSSSLPAFTAGRAGRKHPGQSSVSRTAFPWSVFNERQHPFNPSLDSAAALQPTRLCGTGGAITVLRVACLDRGG